MIETSHAYNKELKNYVNKVKNKDEKHNEPNLTEVSEEQDEQIVEEDCKDMFPA